MPVLGHPTKLHTLIGVGTAALVDAVAIPR